MRTKEEITAHKKAYNRQYRIDNNDRLVANQKKHYQDNKEQYAAVSKKYRETHKEHFRQYEIDNREHRREKWLWRLYKLTGKEFEDKRVSQDNKCAICFVVFVKPYVDHDHATGKTRDLLCRTCNVALGCVNDNIQVLESAILYLKKHKSLGDIMSKFSKKQSGKDHATSIGIAEGLPLGSVHPSHTKIKVPKMAPANTKTQKRAHGFNERSQNGNAEKMGGC